MSSDSSEYSKITPKFKRVLLKLSGEFLSTDHGFGISVQAAQSILDQIKILTQAGVELAIVIGGGNILRGGRANFDDKIKRATADSMGMIATMINALALRDMLISEGLDVDVFSAKGVDGLLKVASAHEYNQALEAGKIVIFAGGTGNPFVTTDSSASLRAIEIDADALLKATTVDGIYDKDPGRYKDAKRFESISFEEVVRRELCVMDLGAFTQCRDFNVPIYVFDLCQPQALLDAITDSKYGTWVTLD
ncbi:UMP kinase [Allofrancisella guangzhouensis]|uniref:Uridylate kinase n=1 Tax=Allofrancisella guangzhouensis TaxID=594679 RepID=A0A0A8E3P2_9GAMM|nr:UMP kinase [Allofrancisella guangzhouensis]AJC48554.1 uridylate kinase [Allofrancisella guangzhouensis]MBK2027780.1 UMP kinase [Allofrancisella guangzhouensis]MBK2043518.1 UMP kinase [Allofrancisella guangzhouensis]MBK2045779.1 UMP kinase [Allofrancisella guangzhouensis]